MPDSVLVDALVSNYSWSSSTITYAFVDAGEDTYKGGYSGGSDQTMGWTGDQMALVRSIYDHVSSFTGLTFTDTGDTGTSNIDFHVVEAVPGGWAGYAGYPSSYYGSNIVIGVQYVESGNVTVHEIGHALGLEHTHDGSEAFPALSGSGDLGEHSLNNELFSVMSYNRPFDPEHPELRIYADQVSFMALDIAALQEMYGAKNFAGGDDTYGQTTILQSIWDSGGVDRIDFSDAIYDAVIDLRAASLMNEPGGGGYLSFVYGQSSNTSTNGGYTIAYGVAIEEAVGGAGNDAITGSDAANLLKGKSGDDVILGGRGGDKIKGTKGKDILKGEKGNDHIEGGIGMDVVKGGNGKDILLGNGGRDKLKGGNGDDKLKGLDGNDKLWGGNGADRFVFELGGDDDKVKDFQDNVDEIKIIGLGSTSEILAKADNVGVDVVIDFGGGDSLTILNTTVDAISDDILT